MQLTEYIHTKYCAPNQNGNSLPSKTTEPKESHPEQVSELFFLTTPECAKWQRGGGEHAYR